MPRPRNNPVPIRPDFKALTGLVYNFVELEGLPVVTSEIVAKVDELFAIPPHPTTLGRSLMHLRSQERRAVRFSWVYKQATKHPSIAYRPTLTGLDYFNGLIASSVTDIAVLLGGIGLEGAKPPFLQECEQLSEQARKLVIASIPPEFIG